MKNTSDNNTAALIHLSALTQYLIPFGNFIFPIIIWSASKDRSEYVDRQGKEAINFQLSIFVYTLVLALIAVPIFIGICLNNSDMHGFHHYDFEEFDFHNVTGLIAVAVSAAALFVVLLAAQFFLVIYATVKTSSGDEFRYPATIRFIK